MVTAGCVLFLRSAAGSVRLTEILDVIVGALHHTQLVIHEYAVSKSSPIGQNPDFKYLESLYICLTAVKSFFDHFLTVRPAAYADLTAFRLLSIDSCFANSL